MTVDASGTRSPMGVLWAGRVLTALFVLFMVFDISIKLIGMQIVDEAMTQLGYPTWLGQPIGLLELTFVALYLIPRTSMLGAVLMTGLLGGAVASHVRVADPLFSHTLFGIYLGVVMWGGLVLREPRVRAVMPLLR